MSDTKFKGGMKVKSMRIRFFRVIRGFNIFFKVMGYSSHGKEYLPSTHKALDTIP